MENGNIHAPEPAAHGLGSKATGQRQALRAIDRRTMNSALAGAGITLRQWAIAHGYAPRTVQQAVSRYLGAAKQPRRGKTKAILFGLSKTLSMEIVPGIVGNGKSKP